MILPKLISFTGRQRVGKSTTSSYLETTYGYTPIRFADPFKKFLKDLGLNDEELEGDLKELPNDKLFGCSVRDVMINLGTGFGRKTIHEDFWCSIWEKEYNKHEYVVTEDIRFYNEYQYVKKHGGIVIKVTKDNVSDDNEYDLNAIGYDYILCNNGSKDELISNLEALLHEVNTGNSESSL